MKLTKTFCLIFAVVFALSAIQIMAFASDDSKESEYSTLAVGDIEIISDNKVSSDTQAKIYAHFSGEETDIGVKGLTCTLFGHKLETGNVTTITHKVRSTAPRCLREAFYYEICTRCSYSNYTLLSSYYIYCCS